MFIGRYYHALEQKGRLSIPKEHRSQLGTNPVLTVGLEGCLFLMPETEWVKVTETAVNSPLTKKAARDWARYLANNAVSVSLDQLGRILIPEHLRDHSHLAKDVVVVGSINRVEIWDRETYHQYLDSISTQAEGIAESLENA